MRYVYSAIIQQQGDDFYTADVPDLPGCGTGGRSLYDVMDLIQDALAGWLWSSEQRNVPIPPPTPQAELSLPDDAYVALIPADTELWEEETAPLNVVLPSSKESEVGRVAPPVNENTSAANKLTGGFFRKLNKIESKNIKKQAKLA